MKPTTQTWQQWLKILNRWAEVRSQSDEAFAERWNYVKVQMENSCLLHRMLKYEEEPSTKPCPVHKGKWAGVNSVDQNNEWWQDGCLCFRHRCGCTTGWQGKY